MGRMKTFGKLLTKFHLEKPGKWHFSPDHAAIKTCKLMKIDLENEMEKPGVGPFWQSGDPASASVEQFLIGQKRKNSFSPFVTF